MANKLLRLLAILLFLAASVFTQAQPVEVIPPELHGASQPQVAVTPKQHIFVAFGKGEKIYCASSLDNATTFLPPREVARLPKLALGMRRGPRIVATNDRITVTAISHEEGNLYAWSSGDGGQTWSHGLTINSIPHSAREGLHAMAGDQRGNIYAVWLDDRSGPKQLWGAASSDGGKTWGNNVMIYQSPDGHVCECCHPSVEVATNGIVRVMWRNWLAGSRDMFTATSKDGGKTFGEATKLGSGTWPLNGCPMDGGGLADSYSVWQRGSAVYYTDGTPGEHLLGDGRQPVVAIGKLGPYFIWEHDSQLMLKTMDAAHVIFSQAGTYPALAVAAANQAPIVVWESTNNGEQTILAQALK